MLKLAYFFTCNNFCHEDKMFKQFDNVPQPDFYDVEVDSEADSKILDVNACPSCDVLLIGANDGNSYVANILHHGSDTFTFNELKYHVIGLDNSDDANEIAEAVLKGNPKKVLIMSSAPLYILENQLQDTVKILSTEVKSTLLPPNYVDGIAAAFYNAAKHLKIPVTVFIAFHSKYQPTSSSNRFKLKPGVYKLFNNVKELPKFEFKHVQESSMYV